MNLLPLLQTLHAQDCGDHYEVEAEGGIFATKRQVRIVSIDSDYFEDA